MPTESQRAMLAAMGIDVYRLRAPSAAAAPLRVGVDARSRVCVDCIDDEDSAQRLLAVLPSALGIARERVSRDTLAGDSAIVVDALALRGSGAAKRALWQSLKPLARRLREAG